MNNDLENNHVEVEKEIEEIRNSALEKIKLTHPEIDRVIDSRTTEEYYEKIIGESDKPQASFKLPDGYENKEDLIDEIVRETLEYFLS